MIGKVLIRKLYSSYRHKQPIYGICECHGTSEIRADLKLITMLFRMKQNLSKLNFALQLKIKLKSIFQMCKKKVK